MWNRLGRILGRSRATASEPGREPAGQRLTTEHVVWAYRLFLDREPENAAVVMGKAENNRTTRELRLEFLSSFEFLTRNPELGLVREGNVVIKELADGVRLFVDVADLLVGMSIIRGAYEGDELDYLRRIVRPGDVVVDAGANIGLFTVVLASLVGPHGRVYAFEPQAEAVALLERSLAENGYTDFVSVQPVALGDSPGRAYLALPAVGLSRGGGYLTAVEPADQTTRARPIDVARLDDLDLRRPVRVIKLDVEGSEPRVLAGARDLLASDRPTIVAEINPPQLELVSGHSPARFLAEVSRLGYRASQLRDGELHPYDGDDRARAVRTVVFTPG
jgi:FkbM family methyltransferase